MRILLAHVLSYLLSNKNAMEKTITNKKCPERAKEVPPMKIGVVIFPLRNLSKQRDAFMCETEFEEIRERRYISDG